MIKGYSNTFLNKGMLNTSFHMDNGLLWPKQVMTRSFYCPYPRLVGTLGCKTDFAGRHQQITHKGEDA